MQCACCVLSSVTCPSLQYFSTLSHKRQDFRKNVIQQQMFVLIFCKNPVWNISHWEKTQRVTVRNVCRSPRIVPSILVWLQRKLYFLYMSSKNTQISNFMKIRPVGAELCRADGRTANHAEADCRLFAIVPTRQKVISICKVGLSVCSSRIPPFAKRRHWYNLYVRIQTSLFRPAWDLC